MSERGFEGLTDMVLDRLCGRFAPVRADFAR
jgi:hypothetical protein